MAKNKNSGLQAWLKANAWGILIAIVSISIAWGLLSAKVSAIEEKVSEYPSLEYFEFRFDTIEDDIGELKDVIKEIR